MDGRVIDADPNQISVKIALLNPQWTEFDWCWYWDKSVTRAYRKEGLEVNLRKDCGDDRCVCRGKS